MSKFSVNDALTECDQGEKSCKFKVPEDRRLEILNGKAGLETDTKSENIDGNYGKCSITNQICGKDFEEKWRKTAETVKYTLSQATLDELRQDYEKEKEAALVAGRKFAEKTEVNWNEMISKANHAARAPYIGNSGIPEDTVIGHDRIDIDVLHALEQQIEDVNKQANKFSRNSTRAELYSDAKYKLQSSKRKLINIEMKAKTYPVITLDSYLVCKKGGCITFIIDGQKLLPPLIQEMIESIVNKIKEGYPPVDEDELKKICASLSGQQLYSLIHGNTAGNGTATVEEFIAEVKKKTYSAEMVIGALGIESETNPERLIAWQELLGIQTRQDTEAKIAKGDYAELGNISLENITNEIQRNKRIADYQLAPAHPIPGTNFINADMKSLYSSGYPTAYAGHVGIDIGTSITQQLPVRAVQGGLVQHIGKIPKKAADEDYGNYVSIKDSTGGLNIYAHLYAGDNAMDKNGNFIHSSIVVQEGTYVLPGQLIGKSGNTGNSTGPHLHYEVQPIGAFEDSVNRLDVRDPAMNVNDSRYLLPPELQTQRNDRDKVMKQNSDGSTVPLYNEEDLKNLENYP